MKICIDAGHGGRQPGAVGNYSKEKDIVLKLALLLRDKLKRFGIEIIMTREGDSDVSLQGRCDIANRNKVDYFISLHANSFSDKTSNGTETFYYGTSTKGKQLAEVCQKSILDVYNTRNRGVKTGEFYVIKYTNMPSVLLEFAFISNQNEENLLNDVKKQDEVTTSLANNIAKHLGVYKEEDVMERIVVYLGDFDIFPAVPVSQKFKCPLMKKADFDASGLKAKEIIQIGGKVGSNRNSTVKDAANLL